MNQHVTIWTQEQKSSLTSLIKDGFSAAQSALSLNALFGTTYTRNAVIGQKHRLKLSTPTMPKVKKFAAQDKRHRPGRYKPAPVFASLAPIAMECSEIIPLNLTSPDGGCQYPYGDGPFTFCGHPRDGTSSYCPAHHALSAGRMVEKR